MSLTEVKVELQRIGIDTSTPGLSGEKRHVELLRRLNGYRSNGFIEVNGTNGVINGHTNGQGASDATSMNEGSGLGGRTISTAASASGANSTARSATGSTATGTATGSVESQGTRASRTLNIVRSKVASAAAAAAAEVVESTPSVQTVQTVRTVRSVAWSASVSRDGDNRGIVSHRYQYTNSILTVY